MVTPFEKRIRDKASEKWVKWKNFPKSFAIRLQKSLKKGIIVITNGFSDRA